MYYIIICGPGDETECIMPGKKLRLRLRVYNAIPKHDFKYCIFWRIRGTGNYYPRRKTDNITYNVYMYKIYIITYTYAYPVHIPIHLLRMFMSYYARSIN